MRIAFIITDNIYVRSFINTGIVKELNKKHEIILLTREGIDVEKKNITLETYKIDQKSKFKTSYFDILITNLKHKSKYFPFRLKRLYRYDLRYLTEICLKKKIKINFLNKFKQSHVIILNFFKFSYYFIISKEIIFKILKKLNFFYYPVNDDFQLKIDKFFPDLVIIPSSGYTPEIYDLNLMNYRYQVIIDNWDNLSSKMIFEKNPDKIYVWGQQSILHANKIHNIPKNKVVKIGCARYSNFFKQRNKSLKKHFKYNYILFLGSSWSWDEESTLEKLDIIFEKNIKIFKNTKIIYRPHPYRQRNTNFNKKYKNILYDPQILKLSNNRKKSWPDLKYYPSLLKNAIFCMGGLTSMLIESTIFYKKYIAIGYDDNQSLMNQKNALNYFEHLEKIENLPNLSIVHRERDLENKFIETYKKSPYILKKKIDKNREYFLHNPKGSISNIILKNLD